MVALNVYRRLVVRNVIVVIKWEKMEFVKDVLIIVNFVIKKQENVINVI